jgi:Tfp pilus assembly protein FimT
MEMSVIVIVIAMLAAVIVPRMQAMDESREHREFVTNLRRIAVQAREEAISSGEIVALTIDEASRQLVLERESGETGSQVVRRLALSPRVTASQFNVEGASSGSGNWRPQFYPDGTADPAGIEFSSGDTSFSLVIDRKGFPRVEDGPIPDLSEEEWSAGDYAPRI